MTENQTDGPLLQAENVTKYFPVNSGIFDRLLGNDEVVHAVDDVSLTLGRNETMGIVGESGCGKSTLGHTLARLYEPTGGTISFDGEDITDLSGKDLKRLRKDVQVIFQDPLSSLNPRRTAGQIVGKPLEVHDIASGEEKEARVRELFDEVGLDPNSIDRYPHEFSGGQQQRIGIARALAVEPKLIIADEPVSALDVSVQAQIINLMKRLQQKYGLAYLFIAHDLSVVKHVSHRVSVMYLGKIVEEGPTEAIFEDPQHPYTRSLLSAVPSVDGDDSGERILLEGNPPSPIDPPSGCPFRTRCPEYIGDECDEHEPELLAVSEERRAADGRPTDAGNGDRADGTAEHRAACHWLKKSAEERKRNDPRRSTETTETRSSGNP